MNKPTFTRLPPDKHYKIVVIRGLPKWSFGKVIGIYPGGALLVEFEDAKTKTLRKMLPKSVVRK